MSSDICGFPRRFTSEWLSSAPDSVGYLIRKLLASDIHRSIDCQDGELSVETTLHNTDGSQLRLPNSFDIQGPVSVLVPYIQEILDLNGHADMLVVLNHNAPHDFEILTQVEFVAKLEFAFDSYRVDRCGDEFRIIHPDIPYFWLWVSPKVGKMFTPGEIEDFPLDSVAYRSIYADVA